jgi:hypothetical protein
LTLEERISAKTFESGFIIRNNFDGNVERIISFPRFLIMWNS